MRESRARIRIDWREAESCTRECPSIVVRSKFLVQLQRAWPPVPMVSPQPEQAMMS
jgi:hypothetical protein